MKYDWSAVTAAHVHQAIDRYDADTKLQKDAQTRRRPRNTFLIYQGTKYPAKLVRGLAYLIATGIDPDTNADNFNGGLETVRFFENLGFKCEHTPTRRR